jgi:hypothetical protein
MAEAWLRRWLYRCTLALSAGLVVAVVVAPWLGGDESGGVAARLLALFGHDATLRRTGLACAAGLAVTAQVFFRPPPRPARPTQRPPSDVAGA